MAINCEAYLNPVGNLHDILTACSISHNVPKKIITQTPEEKNPETWYQCVIMEKKLKFKYSGEVDTRGWSFNTSGVLHVEIEKEDNFYYSFTLDFNNNSKGQTLYSAKANTCNCALGIRLVEIFGGKFIPFVSDKDKPLPEEIIEHPGLFKPYWTDAENMDIVKEHLKFFVDLNPLSKEYILKTQAISTYPLDDSNLIKTLNRYPYQATYLEKKLDKELQDKPIRDSKLKI